MSASILIVDDEEIVVRSTVRILEGREYSLQTARDGVEALQKIDESPFDVVILDIMMPRMNGVELLQSLSALRPDLPVLLMSGYATAELAALGIASPCAVLSKPFSPATLVAEVRRCLRSLLS